MMPRRRALALLFAAGAFLASCAGGAKPGGGEGEGGPLTIGFLAELSGPNPRGALEARQSLELSVAGINGAGGVAGRPVRLITYDSGAGPIEAVKGYQRLSREYGASAVIGPWSASACLALAPVAETEGVPVVSHCPDLRAVFPGLEDSGSGALPAPRGSFFLSRPPAADFGIALAGFAVDWLGLSRFACLFDATVPASGQQASAFERSVTARGKLFVLSADMGPAGVSLGAALERARTAGAEAVLVAAGSPLASWSAGLPVKPGVRAVLFGQEWWPPAEVALPWTDSTGVYAFSAVDLAGEAATTFVEEYRNAYGRQPGYHAMAVQDDLRLILAAARATGSRAPSLLKGALERIGAPDTLTGGLSMDPAAHKPLLIPLTFFTWEKGLSVTVLRRYVPLLPGEQAVGLTSLTLHAIP